MTENLHKNTSEELAEIGEMLTQLVRLSWDNKLTDILLAAKDRVNKLKAEYGRFQR